MIGIGVRLHVAQGLACDPVDQLVARSARLCGRDVQLGGDARGVHRAQQVAERDLEPGRREVRRDGSRRAACADRARPGAAARSSPAARWTPRDRRGVRADSASGASPKATPARSWTTPSWRSAAIRRRSWVDASTALSSRSSRSRCPLCRRRAIDHASGTWKSSSTSRPATSGGCECAQQPLAARADRAEALVDLEQHRRPVGCADRRVRLEQLSGRPFELVLRPAEIAQLGLRAAGPQQLPFVLAQREAPPDQRGLVRVQDRPVLGPHLHAHDRSRQHLTEDHVVQARQGGPIAVAARRR